MNNKCNCLTPEDFGPLWMPVCEQGILEVPTIIDNTKKAGAIYSGSFDIYSSKKNCVETVYIKEVIYSKPATIVLWSDGTKTISKCIRGDKYSEETGLIYCIIKKLSNNSIDDLFDEWIPKQLSMIDGVKKVTLKNVRKNSK